MSVLGVNDLRQLALPNGVDATYLLNNRMIDGTTYEAVVQTMVNLMVATNTMLLNDPLFSTMFYITDEIYSEYESGVTPSMSVRTEYETGYPNLVEYVSHTLPMLPYSYDLKWTFDSLEMAKMSRINRNLGAGVRAVKNNFDKALLTRFTSSTENVITGGARDMPFANASSNIVYTPVDYDGQTFASSHTHFDRQADTAAGRETAIANGVDHLYEHGLFGPYYAFVPVADINDWMALDGSNANVSFYTPNRSGLTYANTVGTTAEMQQERFIGALDTPRGVVYLFATSRLPTNYVSLFAPISSTNDERSALAVRYKPTRGFSAFVLSGNAFQQFPFEGAVIMHDFGVGVGAGRLNGYNCYFAASGSYVNPTIS